MKKEFLITIMVLITVSAWSQEKFTVTGKLTEADKNAKILLGYHNKGIYITDTVVSTNGEFHFSGTVELPCRATIEIKKPQQTSPAKKTAQDMQVFFLEKGNSYITGNNAITATIKGGKAQEDFIRLTGQLKPFSEQTRIISEKLVKLWVNKDTTGKSALQAQSMTAGSAMIKIEEEFIRANPESYVSFNLLQSRANYIIPATFEPLYNGLSASIKNTAQGKELGLRLEIVKKTSIGNPAMNFTQQTADQKSFTLSSLKGKYVLLDFWASWCGPCRGESPFLVDAYTTFKDKNFEIVSISLDEKKEPWLAAIKKDGLTWIHVSDLKGWYNEVAAIYGIRAIPRNFLLDPNGIIIAKNLRGEELQAKLKEILTK